MTIALTVLSIIAAAATVLTFIWAVLEYTRRGRQQRAEVFFDLRAKLKNDLKFRDILDYVESNNPKLKAIPFKEKRDLLGLF
jgi:hypothetical protein